MISIEVKGLDKLRARTTELVSGLPSQIANALEAEAELIVTVAKQRTPVLTGALRASGHVKPAQVSRGNVKVRMGFGGPAVNYAIYVHENLAAFHKNGQAKFLESAVMQALPGLSDRVATRLRERSKDVK